MNTNKGFSLIEVLVTLLLTTVGILGMVVLQNKGIQYTQDAVNRDNAASLANDLIEIMRAHKNDLFEKKPPVHLTYSELKSASDLYTATGGLSFSASDCPSTPPQTLKEHAGCWLNRVENTLPGSSASDVKSKFKLCPSFDISEKGIPQCAGSGYKGSTFTVQLAWEARDNLCDSEKDINEPSICIYTTRAEL